MYFIALCHRSFKGPSSFGTGVHHFALSRRFVVGSVSSRAPGKGVRGDCGNRRWTSRSGGDSASLGLLGDIFRLIYRGKVIILLTVIACVALAEYVSRNSENVYRVSYVVTATDTTSDPLRGLTSPLSLLSGRGAEPQDFQIYLSLLTSEQVAKWVWLNHEDLRRVVPSKWLPDAPAPKGTDPAALMQFALADYLKKSLSVASTDYTSSQYTVLLDTREPAPTLQLLQLLHERANDIARGMRMERAQAQREHLLRQLEQTRIADYRQTLLQLLGRVETQITTSTVPGEYAATIVDGPNINPIPVFPRPSLFFKLAVIAGLVFGFLLVVFTPLTDSVFMRPFKRNTRSRPQRTLRAAERAGAKPSNTVDLTARR